MANIGETVKYGAYGECKITDRREENISGVKREYYILKQANSNSIIYVPIEKASSFKEFKTALTKDEIASVLKCEAYKIDWEADDKARDAFYKKAFIRDDVTELTAIIKSIDARQNELKRSKKKMRATDVNALNICVKLLFEELSRTLDIKSEDIIPIIEGNIDLKFKQ